MKVCFHDKTVIDRRNPYLLTHLLTYLLNQNTSSNLSLVLGPTTYFQLYPLKASLPANIISSSYQAYFCGTDTETDTKTGICWWVSHLGLVWGNRSTMNTRHRFSTLVDKYDPSDRLLHNQEVVKQTLPPGCEDMGTLNSLGQSGCRAVGELITFLDTVSDSDVRRKNVWEKGRLLF